MLNYIGFVYYNLDKIPEAIATYEKMLRIPSIEEQIKKQTLYTLAQLLTMQENYNKALRVLDEWFVAEINPAPDPYILYAQNLYQVSRYADMVRPIEAAMAVAVKRNLSVLYITTSIRFLRQLPPTRRCCVFPASKSRSRNRRCIRWPSC